MRAMITTLLLLQVIHPLRVSAQESRLALVIGNSEYQNAGYLMNPVNDATDIGEALRQRGFEVIQYTNLGQVEMKRAIDQFGLKLVGHEIGLFYYAGHGIQASGINYLIPVDATIYSENDVEYECVDVGRVLAKMEDAGSRTSIVILDACRDNPFERSWTRSTRGNGLAFMNAPTGSLIAYATSPGTTASDGGGDNGLYTSAILEHIHEPDQSILQMFQKVRTRVREVSGGNQIPWESTSLEGDFYMVGPDAPLLAGEAATSTEPAMPEATIQYAAKDLENTQTAKNNTPPALNKPTATNNVIEDFYNTTPATKSIKALTPDYFLSQTNRIRLGDSVYFNRFSSSSWTPGVIRKVRPNDYYEVEYRTERGKSRSLVVNKDNLILSWQKRMPVDHFDLEGIQNVIFFTNYDKLIGYGNIVSVDQSTVTVQGQYKVSGNHTVPITAVLIQDF